MLNVIQPISASYFRIEKGKLITGHAISSKQTCKYSRV